MSETFPISCISCRRRKIKCNKKKPCNQCQRRNTPCQFPSKFRNIEIKEEGDSQGSSRRYDSSNAMDGEGWKSSESSRLADGGSDSPGELNDRLQRTLDKLGRLEEDRRYLRDENSKLTRSCEYLSEELSKYQKASSYRSATPGSGKEPILITGETTEGKNKFYGPQSSRFMIETLKKSQTDNEGSSKLGKGEFQQNDFTQFKGDSKGSRQGMNMIDKSLLKKPLPFFLWKNLEGRDEELNNEEYMKTILLLDKLVRKLFDSVYYRSYISWSQIHQFLKNYSSIKEQEWEDDDELLLLYMVLLVLIYRLGPRDMVELELIDEKNMSIESVRVLKNQIQLKIFGNFEKLRHNLLHESIFTIQAYLLCTEWHFIEQRYEEAWSMMFHTCSITYSIGLHIMGKFRDYVGEDEDQGKDTDIARYKVWFALKNITGMICSILGRPNPLSIQVSSLVLKSSGPDSELHRHKTQTLLKIGLSECLRLSNMMLIENFMIDFTMDDLLNLDASFEKEIRVLEYFLSDEYIEQDTAVDIFETSFDKEMETLPISKAQIMEDLIIFYVSRAKLFEPFIQKFQSEERFPILILSLHYSILRYLDLSIMFLQGFTDTYLSEKLAGVSLQGQHRQERLLRKHLPFLDAFIYQGIMVIFTLLHYKFKEFVGVIQKANKDEINYVEFLDYLKTKIGKLMELDTDFLYRTSSCYNILSSNINSIMKKVMDLIELVYERKLADKEQLGNFLFDLNDIYMDDYRLNLQDPFWITDPDNLPYFLRSPSEEQLRTRQAANTQRDMPFENHDVSQLDGTSSSDFPAQPQPYHAQSKKLFNESDNTYLPSTDNTMSNVWNPEIQDIQGGVNFNTTSDAMMQMDQSSSNIFDTYNDNSNLGNIHYFSQDPQSLVSQLQKDMQNESESL